MLGELPDGTKMEMYNAGMKGQKGSTDEGGVRVPFQKFNRNPFGN